MLVDKVRTPTPKQAAPAPKKRDKSWLALQGVILLAVAQTVLLVVLLTRSPPPIAVSVKPATSPEFKALASDVAALKSDPRLTRLEEKLGQLQTALADLHRPPSAPAGTRPLCPQLDVMVLALNSRNLTLAGYKEAFRGLFDDYARERQFWDPAGNYRLGFYVAQTEQVDARVPFDDPTIKLTSFNIGAPGNHITERLSAIGPRVLEKFSKERPNRRCLVVASTQCSPPSLTDPGWKELPAVDAVLISDSGQLPPSEEFVNRWKSFCRQKKGEATFRVSRTNGDRPDREAVLELRLKLRYLAHPARQARSASKG